MKRPVQKTGKNIANITPKLDWTRKILAQKTREPISKVLALSC